MDELVNNLVGMVQNAGGSMPYKDVHDSLDFKQQQQLPNAIRNARKAGLLRQEVRFENGAVVYELKLAEGS